MAHPGVMHRYTPRLVAFEHATISTPESPNTLLWIGGLGDGLLTVAYPATMAQLLLPNWTLAEVLLSSSYKGWGTGSLKRDAQEIASCVRYFQKLRPTAKIVLMGHSTGCQDIMEYLVGEGCTERPRVQGAILQASISDREALVSVLPPDVYDNSIKLAQEWVVDGRGDDILPKSCMNNILGSPVTAVRWLSLASPNKNGDDDYFSSDLDLKKLKATFGSMKKETPLMFLYSGADPHVPDFVDKKALLSKWTNIIREGGGAVDDANGGIIPRATHNLNGDPDDVVGELIRRVNGFVQQVESGALTTGAHL
ncbi:siderophore biosynthesis lipase/esteras-like protein [Glonium stellatum]|uniref:Siderophore biosynthesis lipase/esteras-like protein n=1 Tax=Glonium stellatum TaxID=574774 RepID=A0A8E2ETF6_9PEZI|nr:siderophore biosynthesis lipase/esteras-like protein [Glonium stellatum]